MIAAIHQIQFMPGLRFFSKMKNSDIFIFLDDVQYEKREFQNRNRIKTVSGFDYITLPVISKGKFDQKINEVLINDTYKWKSEHLKKIQTSYAKTPFFKEYFPHIEKIYSKDFSKLFDISMELILWMRKIFKIENDSVLSSKFNLKTVSSARLADLCALTGADTYLSGCGAKKYLEKKIFDEKNIKIIWQEFSVKPYSQINGDFLPDMSAVDLLFNCGEKSRDYL